MGWLRPGQCGSSLLDALSRALDELGRVTGHPRPLAAGHSLGGILLLALAAEGQPLQAVLTLGTGLDHRQGHADLKHVFRFVRLRGRIRGRSLPLVGFPVERPARLLAPAFGRGLDLPLELDQFHPGSTDGAVVRRFFREGVADLPVPLLLDLAGLFHARGLFLGDHDAPLKERVRALRLPLMLVAGRQDRQCPLGSVHDTWARVPGAQLLEVGEAAHGRGYGHMDLLLGERAPDEVFAPCCRFLAEAAGLAEAAQATTPPPQKASPKPK